MHSDELEAIAAAFRGACEPIGRYQPIRIACTTFPGWTGTSRTVRSEEIEPLPFEPWLASLGLGCLSLAGKSALDVGCCTGSVAFELARRGAARVIGIDRDERALSYATVWRTLMDLDEVHPLAGEVCFQLGDANAPGPAFDFVLFLSVMHHLRRPWLALRSVAARAKEALVIELQTTTDDVACAPLERTTEEITEKVRGETYGFGHFPTLPTIREELRSLGFHEVIHVGPGRVAGRFVLHAIRHGDSTRDVVP